MHKIFNSLGLEIRLLKNLREAQKREKKMKELENYQFLANFDIKSIVDVGANEGQFARTIRHVFPGATIYSFTFSQFLTLFLFFFVRNPG